MLIIYLKKLTLATLFLICIASELSADTQNKRAQVVFISVATETEPFWHGIHGIAESAAKDLGIDLEIMFSNRSHITAINMAKEVAKRKNKPDYVIVVGEKLIASRSIPVLTENGIKVFMYGDLTKEEKQMIGEPRQKYPNYIGKRLVDDYSAGYLTAELMIKEAVKKKLHDKNGHINFFAFEGVRKTSFSSERTRGLNDILKKYPEVKILQSIPTNWTYTYASNALPSLLKRYSKQKIAGVWCANSALARASSDVLKAQGRIPGVDFVTVGTDWDSDSVKSVNRGDILGVAGGHIATVAWIVTLIHDYHNGIDFNSNDCFNKVTVMDKLSSGRYLQYFNGSDWDFIDFTKYSKAENSNLKQYNFSFEAILNDVHQ